MSSTYKVIMPAAETFYNMNGSGCIFEHYGRVPETTYEVGTFEKPLEEAVFKNDLQAFKKLVQEGHTVSVKLKIGKMSCLEYAAMMGFKDILKALIDDSMHGITLTKYFAMDDVVERAYMISKNKDVFFGQEALAEANRYEAALYTAVEYNQPECVALVLNYLGAREPGRHLFRTKGPKDHQKLSATELAQVRGHTECFDLLSGQF